MIAIEKNTGRPTSRVDSSTVSRCASAVSRIDVALLDVTEGILRDDDAGIDEHADGDRNPREAHDVRGNAGVVHAEERGEHRQRKRNRDDENRAHVHKEDDVGEGDERNLLNERVSQRVHGLLDQIGAVVERARSSHPREDRLESARYGP